MEKSVLYIFVLFAFIAFYEAVPLSETPKRKLNEDTNKGRSLLEQLTRERRRIDYYDWEDWEDYVPKCTNCKILSIGNGYKNKNIVTFNGPVPKDWHFSN